ncbi:hypothetical protein NHQ30_000476 [Ciborinia camelliae]|nr:hypothetical protein NHQ30_000476 [Ciborinia camelliae]
MENNEKYLHGRLDPGIESTLQLVEGVEIPDTSPFLSSQEEFSPESSHGENLVFPDTRSFSETQLSLARFPIELLRQISSYLPPRDLVKLGRTCKTLTEVAKTDSLWRCLVQENVPGIDLDHPRPCESFKELYKAHDPHWFLPRNKLWFSDIHHFGKLMISKYDPETGSIGLHRLVAEKKPRRFSAWGDNNEVIVHYFEPRTYLSRHGLRLDVNAYSDRSLSDMGEAERRLKGEMPLTRMGDGPNSRACSKFMLAKSLASRSRSIAPRADQWPPVNIPAKSQVDRPTISDQSSAVKWSRPEDRSQINEQSFRIRQWLEMNGQVRMAEEMQTWSTLDVKLYTPTEYKPYRGIFVHSFWNIENLQIRLLDTLVGDYSGHGTEFLLMDQRDGYDEPNMLERKADESPEAWEERKKHARIYQGSLRAIKLTGDPNVPRGEFSWVADDIGEKGLIRYGKHEWPGARIVKSRGQIGNHGFKNPKYIESQLIMISHDELAQYWVPFGHISFFRRVDIDAFIKP